MSIYASWQTEKSIVKFINRNFDSYEERWSKVEENLKLYARGDNPFKDVVDPSKIAMPPFKIDIMLAFGRKGRDHALAMNRLFSSKSGYWLLHYRKFTAESFWERTLYHRVEHSSKSLCSTMKAISDCLYLGWVDKAEILVKEAHSAYGAKRFYDVADDYSQPLHHFLLRICFDWCQLKFDGWGIGYHDEVADPYAPGECLGEPVLNELFAHWKDSDLSNMQEALLWLCDYYTHRTARHAKMAWNSTMTCCTAASPHWCLPGSGCAKALA